MTGSAGQKRVPAGYFASKPFPLPPLAEQKRIVAKADELMALCDRLEAQQQARDTRHSALASASLARFADAPIPANLQFLFHKSYNIDPADLRKSILTLAVQGKLVTQDCDEEPASELLKRIAAEKAQLVKDKKIKTQKVSPKITEETQPFSIPPSWAWANFHEIIESLKYGTSKKCYEHEEGQPVLRIPNLKNGRLSGENLKYTKLSADEVEQLGLKTRDLLIIRSNGSLNLVGRSATVSQEFEGYAYAGYLVRARMLTSMFQIDYLHLLFESPLVREQIEIPIRHGVGLKNINLTEISRIKISIPPLAEQRRIVAKVDQLMALVDKLETQLATSRVTAKYLLEGLVAELTTAGAQTTSWIRR